MKGQYESEIKGLEDLQKENIIYFSLLKKKKNKLSLRQWFVYCYLCILADSRIFI